MSNLLLTERPAGLSNLGPDLRGTVDDVLELHVTTPGLPPRIARVADRTISLGAGPRCTVQLLAPGLRPMHCLITRTDTGLSVRRWANNTLLNGRSFSEAPLACGDRLSIGDCLVEIHSPASNEGFAESIAEQVEEPIAAVDEAAEMIAADLALDEPAAPIELADNPNAVEPPQVAPAPERTGGPLESKTPSPVEVVSAGSRALTAVPAHLLKPWQAAQGSGDSVAVEVLVAAPVVKTYLTPVASERALTPVWEVPIQPALVATEESTPCTEAETKDFLPLAAAVGPPAAPRAPEADSTVKRLRERLTSSRRRLGRVAQALRTERDSASAQAYELDLLRAGLAAVTAERDELRLINQQMEELHRELVGLQTEMEALERQCEELRAAPANEPAAVAEVESPVEALGVGAPDPWAEFTLDSTPEPTAVPSTAREPEPQLAADLSGWKTGPHPDQAFATATPAPAQQEVSPPQSAGLWEVEAAYSASDAAHQSPEGISSPVDLWGATEQSAFTENAEFAENLSEPNTDDSCPDPFAEEASDWSPPITASESALLDSAGEKSCAAESWSLADVLPSAASVGEGDAPGSPSADLLTLASADAAVAEPAVSMAAEEPVEMHAAEVGQPEAEADLPQTVDEEQVPPFASEPKALSALFTPPPDAPMPAASSPSFIERYAHLLEEDAPSEPIAPQAPAITRPAPLEHSDEDESIDDYMERLLQRMRGESAPPTVEQVVTRSATPSSATLSSAASKPVAPAQPQWTPVVPSAADEYTPPEEPLTSLDEMRRGGSAPETTTDMSALRALANQNARHNIGVANFRQHKEFAFVKFGISVTVVTAGAVLALMAPDLLGVQMIGSCVAMLVAGFYAGRTARLLKEAVKTARV